MLRPEAKDPKDSNAHDEKAKDLPSKQRAANRCVQVHEGEHFRAGSDFILIRGSFGERQFNGSSLAYQS